MRFNDSGKNRQKGIFGNWLHGREELWILSAFCIVGLASSFLTYSLMDGFPYNFGRGLAGAFVPPLLCLSYLSYSAFRTRLNRRTLVKALLLYLVQLVPLAPLWGQVFQPTCCDDFIRYYLAARYMIEHQTLWCADKVLFENIGYKDLGYHFITQPGYRYFVYVELQLFRNLYRLVSFINIGLFILAAYGAQRVVLHSSLRRSVRWSLILLVLLFSPYAIQNSLMGLPEWLTVVVLLAAAYFYVVREYKGLAVFLLGLAPFFRQNLTIAIVLLFLFVLIRNRGRVRLSFLFLLSLLLPVYHNLYYAGEWRFFVDIFEAPFLSKSGDGTGLNYPLILSNILHYFGFDLVNGRPRPSLMGLLFLPLATLLFFVLLRQIPLLKWKVFFATLVMSAVGPIILLGQAYYPRFEFVNTALMLTGFLIFNATLTNAPETTITGSKDLLRT